MSLVLLNREEKSYVRSTIQTRYRAPRNEVAIASVVEDYPFNIFFEEDQEEENWDTEENDDR